jgi:hypothetical protein
MEDAKNVLEVVLRYISVNDIIYREAKIKPPVANPFACFDVLIREKMIGIIYKLKPQATAGNAYFVELNLSKLAEMLPGFNQIPVYELMQKIITLDANVELEKSQPIDKLLHLLKSKIGRAKLWNIEIVDAFPVKDLVKYTIRVSYMKLSDQEAKKLHLKVFKLKH